MSRQVYFKELQCYMNATNDMKEHPLMCPEKKFDLEKLPTDKIMDEIEEFIRFRGKHLTPLSMRGDLYPFNLCCQFLSETYPSITTFVGIDINEMVKKAKIWLLKKGKNISQTRRRTSTGKQEILEAELIKYIKKIYAFKNPENELFDYDKDRWYLTGIPINLRINPTKTVRSISFEKIVQEKMRNDLKEIIYIHLMQKALGTVMSEITAFNRFSIFLNDMFPDIQGIQEVDREIIESYLIHTNTEANGRKIYCKDLCHLKSVFVTAASVFNDKSLSFLFYIDDIGKTPQNMYKVYSDQELRRLNSAIVELDEQIARALIIHQMLGTRISETLMLRQDSVYMGDSGNWLIKIWQVKTGRSYEKAINEDVKKLFDRACLYTNEKHGKCKYVFVNKKNPEKPMQYGQIQYQLMAMITKNNLTDDDGKRFNVGTHIFRHCFGKKLTEMNVDDVIIAKLLGHANTSSIGCYRKVGNEMLCRETRDMRSNMDEMLKDILKEW
ncbi:MAG TPA: recombinase [Lachnospiraceae bacterium]|nr:recombinase [Lachnospiraceae bacterium]